VSDLTWLFVAMLGIWVGLGVYLAAIGLRQRSLERRLEELQERDRK